MKVFDDRAHALKSFFTIASPWSGLTVLISLDLSSRLLAEEAVAGFVDLPYCEIGGKLEVGLYLMPTVWLVVEARPKSKTISLDARGPRM